MGLRVISIGLRADLANLGSILAGRSRLLTVCRFCSASLNDRVGMKSDRPQSKLEQMRRATKDL